MKKLCHTCFISCGDESTFGDSLSVAATTKLDFTSVIWAAWSADDVAVVAEEADGLVEGSCE